MEKTVIVDNLKKIQIFLKEVIKQVFILIKS